MAPLYLPYAVGGLLFILNLHLYIDKKREQKEKGAQGINATQ